ncbi:MAG: hypothetical protein EOP56_05430 [Sphingobacteriales bacterium]|nr:MAG: hypothetical protein EOP56_05430 [Sphingobacteriales bacterium]
MKKLILSALTVFCTIVAFAQGFSLATREPLRSQQQELKARGRMGILIKQKLTFGDYRTTMVKRSAIQKWAGVNGFPGMIWTEHMHGRQSIHFRLTDEKYTSDVMTVSRVAANDLLLGTARGGQKRLPGSILSLYKQTDIYQNNYSVSIVTKEGDEPWELFLDNNEAQIRRKHPAGYLTRGDEYYTIEPVWQVQSKNGRIGDMPFGSAGFEIVNKDGDVMAAVSLIDNGRVYLGPGSDEEKFLFANACAALLLQSNVAD